MNTVASAVTAATPALRVCVAHPAALLLGVGAGPPRLFPGYPVGQRLCHLLSIMTRPTGRCRGWSGAQRRSHADISRPVPRSQSTAYLDTAWPAPPVPCRAARHEQPAAAVPGGGCAIRDWSEPSPRAIAPSADASHPTSCGSLLWHLPSTLPKCHPARCPPGSPGARASSGRDVTATDPCAVVSDASHLTSTRSCGTIPPASWGSESVQAGRGERAGREGRVGSRGRWAAMSVRPAEPQGGPERDRDRGSKLGPGSGKGPNGTWGRVPVVTTRTGCQTTSVWRRDSTRDRCTGRHADGSP